MFDEAGAAKSLLNVIALGVDVRIDFVRHAVVAPIAFESDVVRRSADPSGLPIHLKWRFPDTKVIARCDHGNRLRVRHQLNRHWREKDRAIGWTEDSHGRWRVRRWTVVVRQQKNIAVGETDSIRLDR